MRHIIQLDKENHAEFLELEFTDPISALPFTMTEKNSENITVEVVQCSDCQTVYFLPSWKKNEEKCLCSNEETNEILVIGDHKGNPEIIEFSSKNEIDNIIEGEQLQVRWVVKNATFISLNNQRVQACGMATIASIFKTTGVSLRAVNPSTLFANRSKEIVFKLGRPKVLKFDADQEIIRPGVSTEIRYAVKNTKKIRIETSYGKTIYEKTISTEDCKSSEYDDVFKCEIENPCKLTLNAYNADNSDQDDILLKRAELRFTRQLASNKRIITVGNPVKLSWQVENANKVVLSDGKRQIELESTEYEYIHPDEDDFSLNLIAYGDYGQETKSETVNIRTARVTNFKIGSNFYFSNPKFYLSWGSKYLEDSHVTLSPPPPGDKTLSCVEDRIEISRSEESVEYTLTVFPVGGEPPIEKKLMLYPPSINNFQLLEGEAILGMPATLNWEVENARKIVIDGLAEKNPRDTKHVFDVQEAHRHLTLTVWGDLDVKQNHLDVTIFMPPKITDLQMPLFRIQFQLDFNWIPLEYRPISFKPGLIRYNNQLFNRQVILARFMQGLVYPSNQLFALKKQTSKIQKELSKNMHLLLFAINHKMRDFKLEMHKKMRNQTKSNKHG